MRVLVALLLLTSCVPKKAHRSVPIAVEPSASRLAGQRLNVKVVDSLFTDKPQVVGAVRQTVEKHLRDREVILDEAASRSLVVELSRPAAQAYGPAQCVRVVGRLETTGQAFLPGSEYEASRCDGSPGAPSNDALIAVIVATGQALDGTTAQALERQLAQALSEALAEVLAQVDARAH